MSVSDQNRAAWNVQARQGSRWCNPVSAEEIGRARKGDWSVILTPNKTVPRRWFGEINGKNVLCLASGGGQQVPILAAAGACVTSFDNSDEQLAKDEFVARRDGLSIHAVRGDMADLSAFSDAQFDLIFHPVANVYAPDLAPIWSECHRVLVPAGSLLAGFMNPAFFLFDHMEARRTGRLSVKYRVPYSDLESISPGELKERVSQGHGIEFGHSLDAQIGGQLRAGLVLTDLYEDDWDDEATALDKYMSTYLATLARKLTPAEKHSSSLGD